MDQLYIKRLNLFHEWLQKENVDIALITSPINIYYFTGYYSNPHERFMGLFLSKNAEPILVVPALDLSLAKEKVPFSDVYGYSDSEGSEGILKQKINVSTHLIFGFEESNLSYRRANWLKSLFQITETTSIEEGLIQLRKVKDEQEQAHLQEAAIWADKAIEYGIDAIKIGKSELEVVAEIEYRLKKQGIEKMSFDTMVLAGAKSALPHGKPGKNTIHQGDLVLFDLGVVVNGYCSDISRTVMVGKPSSKQREIYETVKQAQLLAIKHVKPKQKVKEIDLAARNYITEKGYGDQFIHRIGHGLGLDVHELPSIHEKNEEELEVGMVFTIEPGIYLPNLGGVRIEDDIIVTSNGANVLTSFTKELIEI